MQIPLFYCFLRAEVVTHLLDPCDLILRSDVCTLQSFSHAWALANAIRNTINEAEFWRKILLLICNFNDEERLLDIANCLVIDILEVLSNADLTAVLQESHLDRTRREVNILNEVRSIVAPVSDDGFSTEFKLSCLLKLMLASATLAQLVKTIIASFCRHKFKNVVDRKHASKITLVS